MTFVVMEKLYQSASTWTVWKSPGRCFPSGRIFVIDPDECIDCTLCEPECPVERIFPRGAASGTGKRSSRINAELAKQWPVITEKAEAPADAKDGRATRQASLLER